MTKLQSFINNMISLINYYTVITLMKRYILLEKITTDFIHLHLNWVVHMTLLSYQKRDFLPTHVVMFRVTLAFIHILLTEQFLINTETPPPTGGGISVFIRNCYTSTDMANFSVCHACYEISVVEISLSNNCTIIIIGVYRPPDKSKILEFTFKLNEILSSTSQCDHVFIVGIFILTF